MRVVLHKVDDVESVSCSFFDVCEFEIEPLSVALGVVIRSHREVILKFMNPDCSLQVATLESGFKEKSRVLFSCEDIVRIELSVVSIELCDRGCRKEG